MAVGSGNVITTLRDRWSIEQELQAMLSVRSEQEFSDRARRVAESGGQVVPVLLAQLDQADSRFVGVLGVVASFYPNRQAILDELYEAAEDEERPDRGRVSAILILERFLGQEMDPYLLSTLDDPRFMATESIREMIREGEQDPRAWIEYTRSLVEQPSEMIWDVMETLLEIGGARAVPALCLLAQEEAGVVSEAAMHTLGRVDAPAAVWGLQSILPLLPPERRALAERSLLKLQLKQVPAGERPDPRGRWRALVGPPDGHGFQVVWFVHVPDGRGARRFLGLSLHEVDGVQQAYGHHDIAPEMVPQERGLGQVHRVPLPGSSEGDRAGARFLMLEADVRYGLRLVWQAKERTMAAGKPFPIEYRLMGPWLWPYPETDAPAATSASAAAALPVDVEASAGLLYHPAFRGWFADGEWLLKPAAVLAQRMPGGKGDRLGGLGLPTAEIDRLSRLYLSPPMAERLKARLMAMVEWLERAGAVDAAALTRASALALDRLPPERHPLVRAMVELGLRMMIEQLHSLR